AEAPSEAEGEAEGVGFRGRLARGIFQASRPRLFHHTFLVPPSQTPNPNPAIIPRQCSIENCARLQRRTHHPPQNHPRRLFDKWTTNRRTSSKSGDPAPRQVHAKPRR